MLRRLLLIVWTGITLILIWFAVGNYRAAVPLAEENLRGLALTLTSVIEGMATRDPALQSLSEFHPSEVAFFAVIDRHGHYRFHTNADLIGTPVAGNTFKGILESKSLSEERVVLGTGETAYEFYAPLYFAKETDVLQLVLHTYRADAVVRRAMYTMIILFALLAAGWIFGIILYRFAIREEMHRLDMARRERLAQFGEMGAMLAHEIRNPLAGIKGYAQVIEKRPQESRNAGFAGAIVREVLRLEGLVNELLAYAGNDSYPLTAINLHDLLGWAASLARQDAESQHVTLNVECHRNVQLFGNRDKLGQVLLNLINNGLQAMPDGGLLGIRAEETGKNVTIIVSDTGQGVPPEILPRIFDPFFTTKARGTGLGLALCKKIIEAHRGNIAVKSTEGEGTTVSITLPAFSERI